MWCANGTWSSVSRRLICAVTGARSTVTARSRPSCRALSTASCTTRLPASHAVRKASVRVKERTASCAKGRTVPGSGDWGDSGDVGDVGDAFSRWSISRMIPAPTVSATAPCTAGSAASGAIAVT